MCLSFSSTVGGKQASRFDSIVMSSLTVTVRTISFMLIGALLLILALFATGHFPVICYSTSFTNRNTIARIRVIYVKVKIIKKGVSLCGIAKTI